MALSRVLAVDTGAGHVASGHFAVAKGGRLSLDHFALASFDPDAALEAQWSRTVAQSLSAGKRSAKLTGAAAAVIPGHLTLTKFVKTPSVEKSKRAKIIQFEAQQNIPYPLAEVAWAHHTVGDDGLDIEILFAAAKVNVAEGLCAALMEAGLKPKSVIPSVYALYRAFKYNQPTAADSALVVAIGARSTHLLFLDKGRFFARTIPLAGNSLTQAIADEIKQDFAHAEALKLQVLGGRSELPESSPARKAVLSAAQAFVGQLHPEITRSVLSFHRQSGAEPPACIHLTGGGSLVPNLAALLAEKLKQTVERFDPLKNVEVAAGAAEARERSAVLADLVGAAIIRSEQKGELNLLPPSLLAAAAFRRQQPFYVAAAAVVVFALALPAYSFHQTADAAKAKTAELTGSFKSMKVIRDTNNANLEKLEAATKEINAIRDLAASKSNWINFFTDLQRLLTKAQDVWLDSLKVVRVDPTADLPASAPASSTESASSTEPVPTLRLDISGRLLDKAHPQEQVSVESSNRVTELLTNFATSPFIVSKEKSRFDASQPGILKFDFTLVVNPKKPL